MSDLPGAEALRLGLYPIAGLPGGAQAPHAMNVAGTINIIGGGSGGTSMIDNNPFTPGGTSITPAGGYHGGRTVASGNAAAFAIDGSGNMQVNVVAGGAGGGLANLTVQGTANSALHVGYASGSNLNQDGGAAIPIFGTVNLAAGAAPFASVAVYGSPGNPVYNVGSVNVVNPVGITAAAGSVNILGSVGVTPLASFTVNLGGNATVWYGGGFADTANSAIRVNVIAQTGGGSGFATAAVYGSPAFPVYTQFPSGYYPTINIGAGGGTGFATVAIYGSPAFPAYVLGTVNVSNFAAGTGFATAAVYGSPAFPVYAVGSVNVTNFGDTTNSAFRVNVVAGGAGGGVANLTVRGSGNTDLHVGYVGGASVNSDGGAYLPVQFASGYYPTINIGAGGGGGSGFATAAVYGSPAFPVYVLGSINVTNFPANYGFATAAVYGSPAFPVYAVGSVNVVNAVGVTAPVGSVNVNIGNTGQVTILGPTNVLVGGGSLSAIGAGGSMGVTQIGAPWSVSLTAAVQPVDTSASLTPTIFPINLAASGYNTFAPGPSGAPGGKLKYYGVNLITDATVGFNIQSPSGTYLTGSLMQLLPGAGFIAQNVIRNPVWMSASGNAATTFMYLTATAHVVGWAQAYIE